MLQLILMVFLWCVMIKLAVMAVKGIWNLFWRAVTVIASGILHGIKWIICGLFGLITAPFAFLINKLEQDD